MATVVRNPLSMRPQSYYQSKAPSPYQTTAMKRSRSPEPTGEENQNAKRLKPVVAGPPPPASREEAKRNRERKRAEREQEFRIKYRRAFPSWVFYFDLDTPNSNSEIAALKANLEKRVTLMGAGVEDFFSRDITHLVTLYAEDADKENVVQPSVPVQENLLGSPIRLKGRANDGGGAASDHLVKKAIAFGMKVWSTAKLDSVLERCHVAVKLPASAAPAPRHIASTSRDRSLTRLLEDERIHGTAERDPTQRRHDYTYFSKGSYFVLVEDMRQELATIAAMEFPIKRGRDGMEKPTWPILYCHPKARGPFLPYDEKEERRRERVDNQDMERERERERRKARLEEERKRTTRARFELRRSVSMSNLQRQSTFANASIEGLVDLDADAGDIDSANASGYLASGAYVAASGNSVGITSNTGTTSAVGHSLRSLQLPVGLRGRLQQQVVTSRKVTTGGAEGKENKMGPPPTIPDRPNILRKSRSTSTLRLPRREEGMKPGYCESCRVKFEDFTQHVEGRRHRKFALDDSKFARLDLILSRVRRRTLQEVEEEKREWALKFSDGEEEVIDEDTILPSHEPLNEDDVQWDDWVESTE